MDLFTSHRQHQPLRYRSGDPKIQKAEGYNAFNSSLTSYVAVYVNPPWSFLQEVVDEIIQESRLVLLVTPR